MVSLLTRFTHIATLDDIVDIDTIKDIEKEMVSSFTHSEDRDGW